MRLKYNAPVSLTFGLICTFILVCDQYLVPGLVQGVFTAEGALTFQLDDFPAYIRLMTHGFGHANWDHLLQNLTFILLLGPVLEDKYGSGRVAFMMLITTMINGLLNALFFPTELLGASGIAFMMILLTSFAGSKEKEIPISFLAVLGLYLVKEFLNIFRNDDISQMSHIVGGVCGAIYGLFLNFFTQLPAKKGKSGDSKPAPSSGGAGAKETIIQ
ncbi:MULTISPECIES: rhomboid family intramembrane serine protease [unclassified Oceanispirochaeta]|uniref:rhomboid family intramembrane serine protease n=1 Tax=unclassified Oceanispirochaeta TaxID=2635722 RepID=UPI000E096F8D|nr:MULTISPECIES: rhomboid family intramembrane serine protease [unclassified Oceanispirochaeta]MBF9014710.1 rhomboid family intramembrane serine protease [Oceanispirochaeta sp. M2]NPD70966.1 rhomboid family intramembrane serine protease [Oceanispirochaeta sp. M1]RDG33799.1 rhomboid family intramembrane serine protease [Oceanispirochaeta sp. M1]